MAKAIITDLRAGIIETMRIVEPRRFEQQKPTVKKRVKTYFIVVIMFIFLSILAWTQINPTDSGVSQKTNVVRDAKNDSIVNEDKAEEAEPVDIVKDTLRIFSDNEFKIFYDNLLQPNMLKVENPPIITGNDIADARIRKIAEDRGYRLRSSPAGNLISIEENMLQPQIYDSWKTLKSSAKKQGLSISIVSGYRSVDEQRNLFLQRLSASGASSESVALGKSDKQVDNVLITTSIPGYSKHHTGYTIDIMCSGYAFENFKNSPCNEWIIADNYKTAKENGFIPSYPPTADAQGPDPEAWEYVWVGTDLLYE